MLLVLAVLLLALAPAILAQPGEPPLCSFNRFKASHMPCHSKPPPSRLTAQFALA